MTLALASSVETAWWVSLAVALVVVLVVWFLLEWLRRTVNEVDRAVDDDVDEIPGLPLVEIGFSVDDLIAFLQPAQNLNIGSARDPGVHLAELRLPARNHENARKFFFLGLFRRRTTQSGLELIEEILVASEVDKDAGMIALPSVRVIPNGVDLDRFRPVTERPGQQLLFIGSFRHFPNILAYRFFTEQVWPLLAERFPAMTLTAVAGPDPLLYWRASQDLAAPVRDSRIRLLEFVEDVRPLADLLNKAGMETEVVADPMGAVWSKFVFNCVMNPLGALMMGDNAARYDSTEMRALIDEMAAECTAVVRALGGSFAFPPMDFVDKVRSGQIPMSRHAGSMALDIARGAPTEIDELTGFIVREGKRLKVPVPTCIAVYRLVKGLELAAQRRVANPR